MHNIHSKDLETYLNRQVFLCSFYSFNLFPAAMRFLDEFHHLQQNLHYKVSIHIYNQYTLPDDEKFNKLLHSKLKYDRGFGYWCWKPFIISKMLNKMNEGDILMYVDIGCQWRANGAKKLLEYFDYTIKNGMLCGELPFQEKHWTKADLFHYFGIQTSSEISANNDSTLQDDTHKMIIETGQRPATLLFMINNAKNREFVAKWLQVFYDDFSLADDTPSKIPNFEGFKDHRHDQSMFSLLSKLYQVQALDFIHEFHNESKAYPLLVTRNKQSFYTTLIMQENNKLKKLWFKSPKFFLPTRQLRQTFQKYLQFNIDSIVLNTLRGNMYKITKTNSFVLNIYLTLLVLSMKKAIIAYTHQHQEKLNMNLLAQQ